MSGIGFVIPNADFSNSPLGTVTIKLTNAQKAAKIAEDFAEIIGTSEYNSAIASMVKDLLDNELWEKTYALWPVLGSTLNAKKANLKDSTVPMQLMANASAGDNSITFVDTISVGTPVVETNITSEFNNAQLRSVIVRATYTNKPTSLNEVVKTARISTQISAREVKIGFQNSLLCGSHSLLSSRLSYTQYGGDSILYANGEHVNNKNGSWNPTIGSINTIFGGTGNATTGEEGETIPASNELFNGDLYYFLFGHYTDEELIVVDNILANFETAVGKV